MGRRKRCDCCEWVTYHGRSKKILDKCDVCGDVFPCASDCGHLDCMEHKGAKCFVCNRKVKGPEMNFIAASGTGCYVVHDKCASDEDIVLTVTVNEL